MKLATVLILGMCTGSLTGYALAVLAPHLIGEFGLSKTAFGALSTAMFLVAALVSPLAGRLTDLFGGKSILISTFVFFSGGVVILAAAQSFAWLIGAMLLGGVALATTNPATNHLLASRTAGNQQGWMAGIKQSGGQISAVVAALFLPWAASLLGWRGAAFLMVPFAALGLIITWRWLPRKSTRVPVGRFGDAESGRKVRALLPRSIWWLSAYSLAMASGAGAVLFYIPLYMYEEFAVSAAVAGSATGAVGVVGTAARILWGPMSQRFSSVSFPLGVLASLGGVSICLMWIAPASGIGFWWLGIVIYGMSAAAWPTVSMLGVINLAGRHQTGQASGVVLVASLLGVIVSPVMFGYAADATGSYSVGWAGVLVLFGLATVISWRWPAHE
ncbi:MAG: MFS transporter [Acidimicrobiia bacterium]